MQQIVEGDDSRPFCTACAWASFSEFGAYPDWCERLRTPDGHFVTLTDARAVDGVCGPYGALFESHAARRARRRRERQASPGFLARLFGAA